MHGDDDQTRAFNTAMRLLFDAWWREVHYMASGCRRLVRNREGVGAAHYLLAKPGFSPGFIRLAEAGRLELTVEHLVLRREFGTLFTAEERAVARRRLIEHGMRRHQLPLEPY
ncbi:MAG: hypothetical protein ABSE70_06635 [Candidatus Limnocylindrales bacterium]